MVARHGYHWRQHTISIAKQADGRKVYMKIRIAAATLRATIIDYAAPPAMTPAKFITTCSKSFNVPAVAEAEVALEEVVDEEGLEDELNDEELELDKEEEEENDDEDEEKVLLEELEVGVYTLLDVEGGGV